MRTKLIYSVIGCLMLFLVGSFSAASTEVVQVGIYHNPPLVGVDEEGLPEGFFVEIMNHVAEEEGLTLEYSFDTLENSFSNLETGRIDLLLGIAYSDTRAEKYLYNKETVYTNWGQIYSSETNSIECFLDLEGLKVGVEKSDIHNVGDNGIRKILEDFGVLADFVEYPGRVEMLEDLERNQIDVAVVSRLFGEYYESNYAIRLTPIQFNPIKIKVIVFDEHDAYLLHLFDEQMIQLKGDSDSIYYQGLNSFLSNDARLSLPTNFRRALLLLLTALIASVVTIIIGKRIINEQSRRLTEQNLRLKSLVSLISDLSTIKTMEELFITFTNQIRSTLNSTRVELVNLIQYDDGIYFDTEDYITEKYKLFASSRIDQVNVAFLDNRVLDGFIHAQETIYFGEKYILMKFDSSYNRLGVLYIEMDSEVDDQEFIHIYLTNISANLQKIISNIKRTNEKTKLFVSLGELIEKRDHQVANHVKRVSEATKVLAEACGYQEERLSNIVIASSVHDIGKIFVPDQILNKPGKLTAEEFELVKLHATDNLKIMDDEDTSLSRAVHDVVRYHHENWDGSGYPESLKGEQIPYDARIVSIIDVFEALTHARPYKKAWTFQEAKAFIVKNKGIKFDPKIVDAFEAISEQIYDVFRLYEDREK